MFKTIKTIEGLDVKVSTIDYPFIKSCYELYLNDGGYVLCRLKIRKMGLWTGELHKIIMQHFDFGRSIVVDHKDGDKLNNTRDNLRICTHHENMKNRKPNRTYAKKETVSKYKGVYWNERDQKWIARLTTTKYKQEHLGLFKDEISAANCYNWHCEREYGEFAMLNDCPYMTVEEWKKNQYIRKTISEYHGVSFDKSAKKKKWIVQIMHKGKRYFERFETEIEAAKFYNELAYKLKGDKAKLNIIK